MQQTKESEFFNELGIKFDKVIGEGGYGTLYLVYHEQYKTYFAMKKIPEKRFNQAEIDCLKSIDHPNIVSLYKYYFFNGFVYLLMEFCPVDLSMILQKNQALDETLLLKYAHDILLAIKACHDNKIAHSDIKPSNFLIDKYGRIKVCDFGFSSVYEKCSCQLYCGTLLFIAPEVLKKQEYNPYKADIWSIGVTLFYMATHQFPFYASNQEALWKMIDEDKNNIKLVENPLLRQVIMRCLVKDPAMRANIDELLQMPFFEKYNNAPNPIKGKIGCSISQFTLNYNNASTNRINLKIERNTLNPSKVRILKPKIAPQKI